MSTPSTPPPAATGSPSSTARISTSPAGPKKLTGKPAITVGSVGLDGDFIRSLAGEGFATQGIDDLLDRLERDEFDMVAVGRALLQDPQWAAKVLTGRFDELAPYDPAARRTLS